jgi:hypothetical protein
MRENIEEILKNQKISAAKEWSNDNFREIRLYYRK